MIATGKQTAPMVGTNRPATVEFWYWDGSKEQAKLIADWVNSSTGTHEAEVHPYESLIVLDPHAPPGYGAAPVQVGQWVVRDQFGDFFPLPNDIFQATYARLV